MHPYSRFSTPSLLLILVGFCWFISFVHPILIYATLFSLHTPAYSNNSTPLCVLFVWACCIIVLCVPECLLACISCVILYLFVFTHYTPTVYVYTLHAFASCTCFSQFTPLILGSLYSQLLLAAPLPFNKHTSFTHAPHTLFKHPYIFVFSTIILFLIPPL